MSDEPRIVNGLKLPPKRIIHPQKGVNGKVRPGAMKIDLNQAMNQIDAKLQTKRSRFEGRSTRGDWWLMYAVTLVGSLLGFGFFYYAFTTGSVGFGIVGGLLCAISGVIIVPVSTRRLHDLGLSGWIYLLFCVGLCLPYINALTSLAMLIVLGCLDGNIGDNEYGPDPKGRSGYNPPKRLNLGAAPANVQATGGTANVTVNIPELSKGVSKDNLADRLEKLGSLKERGLLTQEEFDAQKKKILEQM